MKTIEKPRFCLWFFNNFRGPEAINSMKICYTGKVLEGFGLSGMAVSPIFASMAEILILGDENDALYGSLGGGEGAPAGQKLSEPGPPTRVLLDYLQYIRTCCAFYTP